MKKSNYIPRKNNSYFIEQSKRLKQLERNLEYETKNNVAELYACICKVLMENHNFTADEVADLFNETTQVWEALVENDTIKNMVDWCEKTTGVELRGTDNV